MMMMMMMMKKEMENSRKGKYNKCGRHNRISDPYNVIQDFDSYWTFKYSARYVQFVSINYGKVQNTIRYTSCMTYSFCIQVCIQIIIIIINNPVHGKGSFMEKLTVENFLSQLYVVPHPWLFECSPGPLQAVMMTWWPRIDRIHWWWLGYWFWPYVWRLLYKCVAWSVLSQKFNS